MQINIYQINPDRDKNNVMYMPYERLSKYQGSPDVDSSIYDKIYQNEVDCKTLESVYQKFNTERPRAFKGHSLSVSDIIEVVESENVAPGFYFCDSFGFKKVDFEPNKTQISGRINIPQPRIDVLLVEPNKYPRMIEMENSFETMQDIVGGAFEQSSPFNDNVAIISNRADKSENPLNRAIYTEPEEIDMSYNELKAKFRQAERENKSIVGYVVFTADSFKEPYTEFERTYAILSNNKAFIDGMGGYSIYGSSLDGVDTSVRLDGYMAAENGGNTGWRIERCYLKDDRNKEMIDIIAGSFIVCYAPPESEEYKSLPKDLAKKYEDIFKNPEMFAMINGKVTAIPFEPKSQGQER